MSATDDLYTPDVTRDGDLLDTLPTEDATMIAPDADLVDSADAVELTDVPPTADLVERINDAGFVSGDDNIVNVTTDNFVTSGDIAGEDVVDFGMSSDASLGGLGVNIDDLPGDETPISRENRSTNL
jgi:hypothetical protein